MPKKGANKTVVEKSLRETAVHVAKKTAHGVKTGAIIAKPKVWKAIEFKLNISLGVTLLVFVFLLMYGSIGVLFTTQNATALPLTPREYLYEQCVAPDCNALLLDKIAQCESQWRMVKNSVSTAYGYFQILDGTEATTPQWKEGKRKFDPYVNVDMGIFLFESRGSNPWNESKHCWYSKYQRAVAEQNTK